MKTDYDVIIVGAGPAGLTCAKILNQNNINTLIVEKKKMPRYKACGGLLSKKSTSVLERIFGEIPEIIKCKNDKVIPVISKGGRSFFPIPFPLNSGETYMRLISPTPGDKYFRQAIPEGSSPV